MLNLEEIILLEVDKGPNPYQLHLLAESSVAERISLTASF